MDGYTTMRFSVLLNPAEQQNVYAFAGTNSNGAAGHMTAPAAYQCATPFGADIGGANPAFFQIANNAALGFAEFDSWLTVGVTDGSAPGAISSSPGFDIGNMWTADTPLYQDDGAIFYMDPGTGPGGTDPITIMQVTLTNADYSAGGTATGQLQGRSVGGEDAADWSGQLMRWTYPPSGAGR
jgi:hypothetical protein